MFNSIQKAIILGAGILVGGFFQSASADWDYDKGGFSKTDDQDIVITLKSDPMANLEEACLAVTFARMLKNIQFEDDNGDMVNYNNVTLFVTLDGVALAEQKKRARKRMCTTPWEGKLSLQEHLEKFLGTATDYDENVNMVVCPICWGERYGDELPDYGVLPGKTAPGNAIGILIGNADKILDF